MSYSLDETDESAHRGELPRFFFQNQFLLTLFCNSAWAQAGPGPKPGPGPSRARAQALFFCARRPPAVFFHQKITLFEQKTHFYDKKPCSWVRGGLRRFFLTKKEHFLTNELFFYKMPRSSVRGGLRRFVFTTTKKHCLNRNPLFGDKSPVLLCVAASGFFSPPKSTF